MKSKLRSLMQILVDAALVLAMLVALLVAWALSDLIPQSAARPPASIKTINDFRNWKHSSHRREGTFTNNGTTYIVITGPAGRYLASGPAAYLFDSNGLFVDWTVDMGDCNTKLHHFELSGRVEFTPKKAD